MRCWCTLNELAASPSLEFFNIMKKKKRYKGKVTAGNNVFNNNKKRMLFPILAFSHILKVQAPSALTATLLPADILTIPLKSKTALCTESLSWWIHYKNFYNICSIHSNASTHLIIHSLLHSFLCVHSTKVKK